MRFAYGGSVDRHRLLALAMTRVVRTEADRDWLPCPFHSSIFNLHSSIYWQSVDRHGLRPRDDKGGIFTMKGMKRLRFSSLSLRGGNGVRDAAIHRVSRGYCLRMRYGYCGTVDRRARKGLATTRVATLPFSLFTLQSSPFHSLSRSFEFCSTSIISCL
jgi:hypothetical protein